jgi:hypothetical protein
LSVPCLSSNEDKSLAHLFLRELQLHREGQTFARAVEISAHVLYADLHDVRLAGPIGCLRVLARQKVAPRHARRCLLPGCGAASRFMTGCARYGLGKVGRDGKTGAFGRTEKQTINERGTLATR